MDDNARKKARHVGIEAVMFVDRLRSSSCTRA